MDIKDVENLAELARIELKEEEKDVLLSDMKSILGYVEEIKKAPAGEIEVAHNQVNVWREDELQTRDFSHELIIEQFPDKQDNFLKVKKIL